MLAILNNGCKGTPLHRGSFYGWDGVGIDPDYDDLDGQENILINRIFHNGVLNSPVVVMPHYSDPPHLYPGGTPRRTWTAERRVKDDAKQRAKYHGPNHPKPKPSSKPSDQCIDKILAQYTYEIVEGDLNFLPGDLFNVQMRDGKWKPGVLKCTGTGMARDKHRGMVDAVFFENLGSELWCPTDCCRKVQLRKKPAP